MANDHRYVVMAENDLLLSDPKTDAYFFPTEKAAQAAAQKEIRRLADNGDDGVIVSVYALLTDYSVTSRPVVIEREEYAFDGKSLGICELKS